DGSANATKRDILSFGLMVRRVTKKNPLRYNNYGCYCGIGGKGTPVDDLDKCCKVHDKCYGKLQKSKVCPFKNAVYLFWYYTVENKPTKCKPASYYWAYGKCRQRLCECDATAAKCFKKRTYHSKYKKYDRSRC
ncbi:phospholipase A2 (consuming 1,2-dipalmitoylphosphatidylcholine), partial [Desmophyllum pertusum]